MKLLKEFIINEKLSEFQIVNLIARIEIFMTNSESKHNFKFTKSTKNYIENLLDNDYLNKPSKSQIKQWFLDKQVLCSEFKIGKSKIENRINNFK